MASNRPTRHSYSAISKYKECPAAYNYRYVLKLPEPSSAAMDRGTRLHKLCEDYVTSPSAEVAPPYDVRRIAMKLYHLKTKKAKPEAVWYVNRDWQACDEGDAWIKGVIDVHYVEKEVLFLHDYKSGREYPSHADQLELYTALGLCRYEAARRAVSSPLYIDNGVEGRQRSVIREMLPAITRKWGLVIAGMEGDAALLPTPGGHCKRCAFGVSKGGPCKAEQR